MSRSYSHYKGSRRHRNRSGSRKNMIVSGLDNVSSSVQMVAKRTGPSVKSGVQNLFGLLSKGVNAGMRSLTKSRKSRRRNSRRY